jgi:hypothetical protein
MAWRGDSQRDCTCSHIGCARSVRHHQAKEGVCLVAVTASVRPCCADRSEHVRTHATTGPLAQSQFVCHYAAYCSLILLQALSTEQLLLQKRHEEAGGVACVQPKVFHAPTQSSAHVADVARPRRAVSCGCARCAIVLRGLV